MNYTALSSDLSYFCQEMFSVLRLEIRYLESYEMHCFNYFTCVGYIKYTQLVSQAYSKRKSAETH